MSVLHLHWLQIPAASCVLPLQQGVLGARGCGKQARLAYWIIVFCRHRGVWEVGERRRVRDLCWSCVVRQKEPAKALSSFFSSCETQLIPGLHFR